MGWESGVSRRKLVGNYSQYPVINHNGKEYLKEESVCVCVCVCVCVYV